MKEYKVFSAIHQLKEKGFRRGSVAKQLGINRRTVERYWDMPVEEYERQQTQICRERTLDKHHDQIVIWLSDFPTLSAAQVCDWLKEHYGEAFSERTVSRYVKKLREEYNLKKHPNPREYEAVPELPMGLQMQVDFGQKTMKNTDGGKTTVYAVGFVLAHSRRKYVELQSRPYTSVDLVRACRHCFRYMGGMPREMVFDQDSIICVSENAGDIIYTYEFQKFREECKMDIYLCRGADPESKGKIENVVKYVKGNFLENRFYVDDDILNSCCLDWLERTANTKIHGTTKRIPEEVFALEREYLRPLLQDTEEVKPVICRTVRKDNTILFDSNRYSVPLGTYSKQPEVSIEPRDGVLYISTTFGEPICEHRISNGRGVLVQNKNHQRDRVSKLDILQNELNETLKGRAETFLRAIRTDKSRYARDQFLIIRAMTAKYGNEAVLEAISFCETGRLYSANTVKDYLEHKIKLPELACPAVIPISNAKYHVTTQKRPIEAYVKAGERR